MRLFAILALFCLMLAQGALASVPGASDWSVNEAGRVRLVTASTAVGDGPTLHGGLHFQLQPGWKIYWRTPGDAGYPPKLDWAGSDNVGEPRMSWPAPKRFVLAGLQNYGYAGEVVLPLVFPVTNPGQPMLLNAKVDYLACAQICVPMLAELSLALPAGPEQPSQAVHDLSRFLSLVPGDGARHGLSLDAVEVLGSGDGASLRVVLRSEQKLDHPDVFVEPLELASFEEPKLRLSDGGRSVEMILKVVPGTATRDLAGAAITLTAVDGLRSMQADRVIQAGAVSDGGGFSGGSSIAFMAAIALVGGLILNLMPCVLPVLSIKVLGALGYGGAERGHIRAAFLASAAGIVTSFLALAAAAIAVKAAGQAVGWGIQFQQPLFLTVMVVLLLGFAANLWGLFEIRLPTALMSVGTSGVAHHTLLGHFLSGAFATLLATPCSAPFLGTAVGFALARGSGEIVVIFAALGVGMAVPYLAVAAWPGLARKLPRPGPWMVTVKKVMGLALAGTAIWLGTILATVAGWQPGETASSGKHSIAWQDFDQQRLAALVAEGKTVFVDVTADWCITCKVNKAAVVERGEVAERLASGQVVPMRADWTKPDDAIARYLASFGRYGIPFNAVYGPKAKDGIALPELLTETDVLAAFDKAR